MALFGFNKQKVLASAEKSVQQGKLQNAITEYEKIIKHDPKDLTVTNTIGDLYSRIGESDKATECFKSVGDAYASQGFTVKAIAMYKKISKLKPSLESVLKLAELYTQQGLFNDARAQYLQVAEEFLKNGELDNAVRIFQKILEMDPENTGMRVRLAEVYIRLGKKNEAWQIFTAAAESLRAKGSLNEAEEILQRMLKLDPGNAHALLMQGKNLVESGDAAAAVVALQKVSDIDSNPDALRDLLKAYLQTGQLSDAGAVASKLLTVHNDLSAVASFADALMQAGQFENALQVYDQHAERLLAENSDKVLQNLHTIIGHVRENPDSLQKLLDLFQKAGETTHIGEVTELLAHASVQAGDLSRAKDLYQKLAQIEPQNALHMQNYQQVASQLGGASGGKLITPEEAVVLIDDLEATAPSIHQHYSDEVALAVRSALTDAELFISYNMPHKALGPLTGALPMAPQDLRLNQRLAALHTRAGRFAEAALCCRTLQSIYSEADHPEEATRYGELADRYEERSTVPVPGAAPVAEEAPVYLDAPAPQATEAEGESEVSEFAIEESSPEAVATETETAPEEEAAPAAAAPWPSAAPAPVKEMAVEPAETEFAVEGEAAAPAEAAAASEEIDLSSEWDDAVTVEAEEPAAAVAEVKAAAPAAAKTAKAEDPAKIEETIEEIRFYLSNGMPEQAQAALAKLEGQTSDRSKVAELRAEVEAALQQAAEHETAASAEPVMEELTADDIPSADEETVEVAEVEVAEAEAPAVEAHAAVEEPVVEELPVTPEPVAPEPVEAEPVVAEAAQKPALKEFVSDLESSLGSDFQPSAAKAAAPPAKAPGTRPAAPAKPAVAPPAAPTIAKKRVEPVAPAVPVTHAEPVVAATPGSPVLGEFVADIEASLGEDFLKGAPVEAVSAPPVAAKPAAAPPVPAAARTSVPAAAKTSPPMAASAAASASTTAQVTPSRPSAASTAAPAWPPAAEAPKVAAAAATPSAPAAKASPFGEDAGVDLAEMFGELKQDLEADVSKTDEDPETHYNLGIAFREMGLLDEAIGELQKACQSHDHGHAFPQIMQTYTWLAQCFLDKGVPEAAVRWYDRALSVPTIDGETRVALNYELAAAYETAGDKPAALRHFMDVYGSNIDYRDVAERIKALKS